MHDLVIRSGTVVDGTGAPGRVADVAISDGVVTHVGGDDGTAVDGPARQEIDADGALVTPGFVDVHTHYDGQATWDALLSPSCWHGVTTVVMGNCGVGFAPVAPDKHDWLIGLMEGVEDIPGAALSEGIRWGWESFPEYLDAVDAHPHVRRHRHPGPARRGARLRDGRPRRVQRARHPRRHRGDGRHRARRHPGRRPRVLDLAHPRPPGDRRRAGARARSRPRTSCSASAPCSASSAPACSSWPPPARWARTSPPPSARSTGCGGCPRRSAGPSRSPCCRTTPTPTSGAGCSTWPARPPPRAWPCDRRSTGAPCRSCSGSRRSTRSTSPPPGARPASASSPGTSRCGASRPSPSSGPGW